MTMTMTMAPGGLELRWSGGQDQDGIGWSPVRKQVPRHFDHNDD